MQIIETSSLSETQIHEIARLTKACCTYDKIRLTYPYDESGDTCRHYLLYEANGSLSACLAMLPLDGGAAECSAFTHPACRRQGYFSRLLKAAMERYDDYDILFGVPESCLAAREVLSALGAELESREHQMELVLPKSPSIPACHAGLTLISSRKTAPPATEWTLMKDNTPVGRCLISPVSGTCACLHHLEIEEPFRQKGYGSSFLALLLPHIAAAGIRKIILQVSGNNPAAMALYQKTGFRITETLSFYCY